MFSALTTTECRFEERNYSAVYRICRGYDPGAGRLSGGADRYCQAVCGRLGLDFPPPSYLFTNGIENRGVLSGPVNAPRPDLSFFTAPVFGTKGHSGRLYYQTFHLANRHDPAIGEQNAWFICWQPAGGGKTTEPGDRAQRLFSRAGYDILEVETDGRHLLLRLTPAFGSKNKSTPTDTYHWAGDNLGHGAFVPDAASVPTRRLLTAPNDFQRHRDWGYLLLKKSNGKQAGTKFQKALALRPKDAACWFALGVAREGSGGTRASAIAAYSHAIAQDPTRTPAYRNRAALYVHAKQYDLAVADLSQGVRLEPKLVASYTERAQVYAVKGDYAHAAGDARAAAALEPGDNAPLTLLAGYLYRSGNDAKAIVSAQRALKIDEADNGAHLILAYIYARQNQAEKARAQIIAARANGITYTERHEGMAEIQRLHKAHPTVAALKATHDLLRDPEDPAL